MNLTDRFQLLVVSFSFIVAFEIILYRLNNRRHNQRVIVKSTILPLVARWALTGQHTEFLIPVSSFLYIPLYANIPFGKGMNSSLL